MAKNKLTFLGGAVVGLALGVAASLFLTSKKGKKLTKDMQVVLADFYKGVAPKLKNIKKMGEEQYKEFMEAAARQYGKAKKLSEVKIKELVAQAKDSWRHFNQ